MNNQRGVAVLAVIFIGLFLTVVGYIVGTKKPGLLNARERGDEVDARVPAAYPVYAPTAAPVPSPAKPVPLSPPEPVIQ